MNTLLVLERVVQPLLPILSAVMVLGVALWLHRMYLTPAPPPTSPHPAPLERWTRAACAVADRGGLLLNASVDDARRLLAVAWEIVDRSSWTRTLVELLAHRDGGIEAWHAVRAIRVLLAGARVGFTTETLAWEAVRAIALDVARRHRSFRELAASYVVTRRRWLGLPIDGSRDDATMKACLDNLAESAASWSETDFTSFLVTPVGHTLPNIDYVRSWLEVLRSRVPAPEPPPTPLVTCEYCRVTNRAGRTHCAECGAPIRRRALAAR